jgi:hypothetical protein
MLGRNEKLAGFDDARERCSDKRRPSIMPLRFAWFPF